MKLHPTISPGRFADIAAVFARYGFEDALGYLNLPGRRTARILTRVPDGLSPSTRIRMALEELGPTFVKFGQILSLRADLFPRELISELEKLQDKAAPIPHAAVRKVMAESLPQPPETLFAYFEAVPLAAASLSQVHRAVLRRDGRNVAVKVQRPDIRAVIEQDLDIFAFIVRRLDRRIESLRIYDLPGLVDLLRRTLDRELSFKREARYMRIAREQMKSLPGILIPAVERHLSSEKVLVMEHVQGVRPGRLPHADAARLASLGLEASVRQILENGFFHADPHPGNMRVVDNRTLCLLDWGMVGRLTPRDREQTLDFISAVVDQDSERVVEVILSFNGIPPDADRRQLQIDVMDLLDLHTVTAVADIRLGRLLQDMSDLIRVHRLQVPRELYLMFKAMMTAEGTARLLNPDLDIIAEVKPHLERLARARYAPSGLWHRLRTTLYSLVSSPARFPKQVADVVEKMKRGDLRVRFEHHNLGDLRRTLEKTASRLTLGIISGAVIIGSSLLLVTKLPPTVAGYSVLGLTGYLMAGLLGLWVAYDILRSG